MTKKTKKQKQNIITQSEAAEIAGVGRQAIGFIKKSGTYNFFIQDEKGVWKVDIEHPHWKSYLHERDRKQGKQSSNKSDLINMIVPEERGAIKNILNKFPQLEKPMFEAAQKLSKDQSESLTRITHSPTVKPHKVSKKDREKSQGIGIGQGAELTGGYDISNYVPQNIADVKRLAEIVKIKIEMKVRMGELIDREIVHEILDEIQNVVQSYFVDLPRKQSATICQKLDRVGMEKEVERILSEPIAKGIRQIKEVPDRLQKKIIKRMSGKI